MQKLKMIGTMLLIIFLSGCQTVVPNMPRAEVVERCVIKVHGAFSKCRCQDYRIDVIGGERIGPAIDHPASYCSDGVVFRNGKDQAWAKLTTWRDNLIQWSDDIGAFFYDTFQKLPKESQQIILNDIDNWNESQQARLP